MLDQIRRKFYYRFLELVSLYPLKPEDFDGSLKKCFIYFDYEREFSGHQTKISDLDIDHLLDHLEELQLKTTWFTVGKILKEYPGSISKIVDKGHEIGSHTYAHISPKVITNLNLKADFESFEEIRSIHKIRIEGFHSPNGQWNLSMFDFLLKQNYTYDVISLPLKGQKISPMQFKLFKKYEIVRLVTIGDDWPLFGAAKSRMEVFDYFKNIYLQTKKGDVFGIGFHPWILYSDLNILMGYKDFLLYLTRQKDVIIQPARNMVPDLKKAF